MPTMILSDKAIHVPLIVSLKRIVANLISGSFCCGDVEHTFEDKFSHFLSLRAMQRIYSRSNKNG